MTVVPLLDTVLNTASPTGLRKILNNSDREKTVIQVNLSGTVSGSIQGQLVSDMDNWATLDTFTQADAVNDVYYAEVTTMPMIRILHTSGTGSLDEAYAYPSY